MSDNKGPYLIAAALCDRVLQEKDGTLSLIRVSDSATIRFGSDSPEPPSGLMNLPPHVLTATVVVMLRAGSVRGQHQLRIVATSPSGANRTVIDVPTIFHEDDDSKGVNYIFNIDFRTVEVGLFWLDIAFDDRVLTRVPLTVHFERMNETEPEGAATPP